jgi:hypothetical protein
MPILVPVLRPLSADAESELVGFGEWVELEVVVGDEVWDEAKVEEEVEDGVEMVCEGVCVVVCVAAAAAARKASFDTERVTPVPAQLLSSVS